MKILVAADISPTTICVVEFLQKWLKLAAVDLVELMVVHVYEPELDYEESAPEITREISPISEKELKHIFQPLSEICKIKYIITNEKHGDSILSRGLDVDMIVMGRRRRNQLEEMVLGSLSQYVLHRATCPVIIVPEPTARQVTQKVLQIESFPATPKPTISNEAFARLKVLIYIAKVDGNLDEQEKAQLKGGLQAELLPDDVSFENLLNSPINLEEELIKITSKEEQELTYYAAYILANSKTEYHPDEMKAVNLILEKFQIAPEKVEQLENLVNKSFDFQNASIVQPIDDPKLRNEVIELKILRCAIATSVLGGFPSPLLSTYTEAAAFGLQTSLISEIAALWGHQKFKPKPLLETMVVNLGLVSAWLVAVDITKLVPKLGSAIASADAFTATWAMGKAANSYFSSGQQLDKSALRQTFRQARKEGDVVYQRNQSAISQQQKVHATQIKSLTEDLRAGRLILEEYQKQIQKLLVTIKQPSYL
ncbi:MAG: universal stress protein [Calothrix sp. CSU_2_0]|nr:universal stress protein [Calothrix sp. CSU_2_0]